MESDSDILKSDPQIENGIFSTSKLVVAMQGFGRCRCKEGGCRCYVVILRELCRFSRRRGEEGGSSVGGGGGRNRGRFFLGHSNPKFYALVYCAHVRMLRMNYLTRCPLINGVAR